MDFKTVVEQRYATKNFTGEQLPQEKVDQLLDIIRLAPSSYGLQCYKIIVIFDKNLKEKLLPHSYKQQQITTCSHILVFCADEKIEEYITTLEGMLKRASIPKDSVDMMIGMMNGFAKTMSVEKKISWAQRNMYIALGNAVNGAKALGFDSCPMEGFVPSEYSKILGLPSYLHPTALVTIGIAADKPRAKLRFQKNDMFITKP